MFKMRYSRLEALPGIGNEGISRLRNAKVLVVGCGALGSMCAMYLAASGVGRVAIADFDTVDISNLQRQLFFAESHLGLPKVSVLAQRIREINSETEVELFPFLINESKAGEIFPGFDFIIDGSDNPSTKSITASVCQRLSIPYCIGGVREFSGQVMSWASGHAGYADLFGDVASASAMMPCASGGVLGPAAGIVASVQAAEAIKHLTGAGKMLYDKILCFDLADCSAGVLGF